MRRVGGVGVGGLMAVLHEVAAERASGALTVAGDGEGGRIWLRDGGVVYAETEDQAPLLGVLLAAGVVTPRDVVAVAAGHRVGAAVAGSDLVRRLDLDVVELVLGDIVDTACARLLSLPEAQFRLDHLADPPLPLPVLREIRQVLAFGMAWPAVRRAREHAEIGRLRLRPVDDAVLLDPHQWAVVVAMSRAAAVVDIAAATGTALVDTRRLLQGLAQRGLLEYRPPVRPDVPATHVEPRAAADPTPSAEPPAAGQRSPAAPRPATSIGGPRRGSVPVALGPALGSAAMVDAPLFRPPSPPAQPDAANTRDHASTGALAV